MSMPGDEALPADDVALEKLLRDRKHGPPYPFEVTPWDFVRRCWSKAVVRERVWPIVSKLLVDDDELVRARAVEFVRCWDDGADVTMPRLLEVAEHAALYGDQKPEGVTLRHDLASALCTRSNVDHRPRVAALLREMVKHEPVGDVTLAEADPTLVILQAQRCQDGTAWTLWLIRAAGSIAFSHRDAVLPLLEATHHLGEATRKAVLAAVEELIQRDEEKARVIAGTLKVPPPTRPAPSPEECKRAAKLT